MYQKEKITDLITRIRMPGDVFTYLVKGTEKAILIDTGLGLKGFRSYVEELLNGMPYEVVLTHGHVDHAGGASEFDRVWMMSSDLPIAAAHTQKAVRTMYLKQSYQEPFTEEDLVEAKKEGYLPMAYGQVFEMGGETLEILNFGGHTPGSVGILFVSQRILLTGDACCSNTLLFARPDSLSVADYQKNLISTWKKCQGCMDTMLYSHPHNFGGPEVIPQMIDLCTEILEEKDQHIPMEMLGQKAFCAKQLGPDVRRIDGKIANLCYS